MKNDMCAEVRHDRAGHNYSLSDGADQHYNSCDIYIGLINYWPLHREECKLESKEWQKFASSNICFCLCAKSFDMWKPVPPTRSFSCKSNYFAYCRFCMENLF